MKKSLRRKLLNEDGALLCELLASVQDKFPSLASSIEQLERPADQVLCISRKRKAYYKATGPLDRIRLVMDTSLRYTAYIFYGVLDEGTLADPKDLLSLSVVKKMANEQEWLVCDGITEVGYNVHHKDAMCAVLPPDCYRHRNCSMIFHKAGSSSTSSGKSSTISQCEPCRTLKYYLNSRKRVHQALSTPDRIKRQNISSTVPFDYLSPSSKGQRLKNMRRTIVSLGKQLKSMKHSQINSIELKEEQSGDMAKFVQAISESEVGCTELERIYEEGESVRQGMGMALQNSWENDVFFGDQERNGKCHSSAV